MNKIEIKNRYSGSTIFEYETENNTIKKTLEKAVNEGIDLSSANLSNADLRYADLSSANLSNANLRGAYIYLSDEEIDQAKVIDGFEKNTNIKITESYINHDVIPTRWNCFWKNGLIIRKWEVSQKQRK